MHRRYSSPGRGSLCSLSRSRRVSKNPDSKDSLAIGGREDWCMGFAPNESVLARPHTEPFTACSTNIVKLRESSFPSFYKCGTLGSLRSSSSMSDSDDLQGPVNTPQRHSIITFDFGVHSVDGSPVGTVKPYPRKEARGLSISSTSKPLSSGSCFMHNVPRVCSPHLIDAALCSQKRVSERVKVEKEDQCDD